VRPVRFAGRSVGARLHCAVLLELGADRHVLPVQATGQGVRRRTCASRDRCRAGEMFPHAQGQIKLTGVDVGRLTTGEWGGTAIAACIFTKYRQVQNT